MYEGSVFFWSTDDLRAYNCATSPSLGDLHKMTVTAIKQAILRKKFPKNSENVLPSVEKLLNHLTKRQADKYYYLQFLGALHSRGILQPIFAKDYIY